MPEYLSPGVFIEEVPARLKAIEGVSTSTAGFVGIAERGPEAGFDPFASPPEDVLLDFKAVLDPTPVLVTSFAEFSRLFGLPRADPAKNGYLAHAAQAFFNNGGKRLFVARATAADATAAFMRADTGVLLRLLKQPRDNDTTLFLNSLRGLRNVLGPDIEFKDVMTGSTLASFTITSFNHVSQSITVPSVNATQAKALDPSRVYAEIPGSTLGSGDGPRFVARSTGAWADRLRVTISCSDGPAAQVMAASTTDLVQVASTSSFYRGAVVQVCKSSSNDARTVADILPGNVLRLSSAVTVLDSDFLRIAELDVTVVDQRTGESEVFRGLTWNASPDPDVRRRHYSSVINSRSRLVYCQPAWAGLDAAPADEVDPDFGNMPMTPRASPLGPATADSGDDGDLSPTQVEPRIVGADAGPGQRSGIQSLQDVEDIRIIAAPGLTGAAVQNALIGQCERMRYRFAVLDGEEAPAGGAVTSILAHRNAYDSSFAAYYAPWVEITEGANRLHLPPSGHVVGVYARTDIERGVHKAPANEVLRGITGLRSYITTGEQDILNPRGVNAIRRFEGRGIRVWGARTLSSDPEFRYVNVRRFLIFLEASLDRGTQYVVFEPNAPETWSRVVDSVSAFLHTQWRNGALFGRRPEDAFFVRCDETTMTVDDIQNGRLICLIGVAIVRPPEFVIFRIEQITGFAPQP